MILFNALWYIVEIVSLYVWMGEANTAIITLSSIHANYTVLCVVLGRQLRALIHAGAEISQKAAAAQPQMAIV